MISVDRIVTFEQFQDVRTEWDKLYQQDKEADFFLSWIWLSHLFHSGDNDIFILAVKSASPSSRYCAFLPLSRDVRFSAGRNRFFNSLSTTGKHWADSTGLICDPESEDTAVAALAFALKTLDWQGLALERLKISSRRRKLIEGAFSSPAYTIGKTLAHDSEGSANLQVSPVIELPDTFELYLNNTVSPDLQQKMKDMLAAFDSDSSVSIEQANDKTIDRYLKAFDGVQVEGGSAIPELSVKSIKSVYTDMIRRSVMADDMLVVVLLHNSNPMGLFACYKDQVKKQLYFYAAAYLPEFISVGGGLALHTYCIHWAIKNNYSRYHLLRGDEPHKYLLGASDTVRSNLLVYKNDPSPASQLLHHDVKAQTLALISIEREGRSVPTVHKFYSQLLESWPNNPQVLTHYAQWLDSVKHSRHADDIRQFLTQQQDAGDSNSQADAFSNDKPIDMQPFVELSELLEVVQDRQSRLEARGSLHVRGLQIDVAASDAEYITWLKAYLYPLAHSHEHADENSGSEQSKVRHGFNCINSNELITAIMRLAGSGLFDIKPVTLAGREIDRLHFTADVIIDIYRPDGVVWIADNAARQLTLLMSSRTPQPSLEVSRTGRALITGYLQQEGWVFLHSGAVRMNDKIYLVVGDEGHGKTSLILALMSAGCEYISNERVFARQRSGKVEALSFPMPVAIGLGAAQQYPEIMKYVYLPESCLYPNRRLNAKKLRATSESKWSKLSDKVQLLVPELNGVFGQSKALQGGEVEGVIVPSIVKKGDVDFNDVVTSLKKSELKKVVSRNRIRYKRDSRYPAWLPLSFKALPEGTSGDLVDVISRLPSVHFTFFASTERKERIAEYPALLGKKLAAKKAKKS